MRPRNEINAITECILNSNVEALNQYNLNVNDINELDILHGTSFLDIAFANNKQIVLDYFYLIATQTIPGFFDKNGWGLGHWAIATRQDLFLIKLALSNYNINHVAYDGETCLSLAARIGDVDIFKFILESGAKLHLGNCIFKKAARYGHVQIINELNPADFHTKSINEALFLATMYGHEEVVYSILSKGYSPVFLDGNTVIHIAAVKGHFGLVKNLLELYPAIDINKQNMLDGTALHCAVEGRQVAIVKMLLDHNADVNLVGGVNNYTPFALAMHRGYADIVELFIDENKINLEKTLNINLLPLQIAVINDHFNLIFLFLLKNVNVNALSPKGEFALWHAVQHDRFGAASLLLKSGARPNQTLPDGRTPLFLAAQLGNIKMLNLLIEHGANCNLSQEDGITPLMIAARSGHLEVVKCLLPHIKNIDAHIDNHPGLTAVRIALEEKHFDIAHFLIENNCDLTFNCKGINILTQAAILNASTVVEALLKRKINVNGLNDNGSTAVGAAFYNYHFQVMQLLLENGADPNLYYHGNKSLLLQAMYLDNVEIFILLLKFGANPNVANKKNISPLHYYAQNGNLKMVNLLLKTGANPNVYANNIKVSPLSLASKFYHDDVVDLLLNYGAVLHENDHSIPQRKESITNQALVKEIENKGEVIVNTLLLSQSRRTHGMFKEMPDELICKITTLTGNHRILSEDKTYDLAKRCIKNPPFKNKIL